MAYFHCLIGSGSSGGGYELTVTCDADFAGTTITCTDGVTTLTQTCPSASPYEVVFEIPNGGDWTISGVVGGHTVSTGVSIPTSATLNATIQQTVTIYSATEDTVTYEDIYGDTQTEVFASGQSCKQITVDIEPSGSSITFTSGVAKDPSDLTAYYSKTVTIDSNTTDVYLMPDNALYWYGYESSDLEDISTANGWSVSNSGYTFQAPTHNTHDIQIATTSNKVSGVGSKTSYSNVTLNCIIKTTALSYSTGLYYGSSNKSINVQSLANYDSQSVTDTIQALSKSITSGYLTLMGFNTRNGNIYALWYE